MIEIYLLTSMPSKVNRHVAHRSNVDGVISNRAINLFNKFNYIFGDIEVIILETYPDTTTLDPSSRVAHYAKKLGLVAGKSRRLINSFIDENSGENGFVEFVFNEPSQTYFWERV